MSISGKFEGEPFLMIEHLMTKERGAKQEGRILVIWTGVRRLPVFQLRPAGFFRRFGTEKTRLDFPKDTDFSQAFDLRTDDRELTERLFTIERRRKLVAQPRVHVSSAPWFFVVWWREAANAKARASEVDALLEVPLAVLRIFTDVDDSDAANR